MTSRASLVNGAMFRKNLTRFAPLWGIFLGILALSGPVSILQLRAIMLLNRSVSSSESTAKLLSGYVEGAQYFTLILNFVYAILCAALLFHYLHNRRSAYAMHALPVPRSAQFGTHVCSGLCFALVPYLTQVIFNLLFSIGLPGQEHLLLLLAYQVLTFLFFFGLAVFCMLLSGRTVIAVLTYIAVNFIGWVLPALVVAVFYFTSFGLPLSVEGFTFLSPIIRLFELGIRDLAGSNLSISGAAIGAAGIYAAIGLGFLVLAWLHYRVRQIERAGEAMCYRWAKFVFLLLFTLLCALGIGLVLTLLFSVSLISSGSGLNIVILVLCFAVGAFIGYFAAQMMLRRTVRVFGGKVWIGYAILAGALTLFLVCVRFDLFGVQHRMPTLENLASATVSSETYNYGSGADVELTVTDGDDLSAILRTHTRALYLWDRNGSARDGRMVTITYHLKNGSAFTRTFGITDPESSAIGKALSKPEYAVAYYDAILPADEQIVTITGYVSRDGDGYDSGVCTNVGKLREAMLQDAAEGNLPIVGFLSYDSYSYTIYFNELTIEIPDTATHTLAQFTPAEE